MTRHLNVLRQFLDDTVKLQNEVESALSDLRSAAANVKFDATKLTQSQILTVYRPIHSLKSISSMIEEGKPLTKVFHEFENLLPPLLKGVSWELKDPVAAFDQMEALLSWSRRYLGIIEEKISLYAKLGLEPGGGEVGVFTEIDGQNVWIHLSLIQGLFTPDELEPAGVQWSYGDQRKASFGLVVLDESGSKGIVWIRNLVQIYERNHALGLSDTKEFSKWLLHRARAA